MRTILAAALLLMLAVPAAMADSPEKAPDRSPGQQIDQLLQDVLDAIGLVLKAVPQYELPEVQPNGDIIIRRVRPEERPEGDRTAPAEKVDPGVRT